MIFDLHIHEATYSDDSSIWLKDIVTEAKRKGLNGICITDHESDNLKHKALDISREMAFPIIVGIEILTTDGDLLVFGIEKYPTEQVSAQELIDWTHERGGVCIAAHPYRQNNRGLEDHLLKVSGMTAIEGLNGRTPDSENLKAVNTASKLWLPMTGGSDAHLIHEVGSVATRFEVSIRTESDLVEALKSGQYHPVVYNEGTYCNPYEEYIEIIA